MASTQPLSKSNESQVSLKESQSYCRKFAVSHRENFIVASCLLPREIKQHFYNVYAYCRGADDLADEIESPEESLALLSGWQEQLDLCYDGNPSQTPFIALQDTIQKFDIPRQPFVNLLTAFRQDQHRTSYPNFQQLLGYCENSANPVGHIVLHLARSFETENIRLSDSICTGLQLVNFWQDIKADRKRNRIYIPKDDRVRFSVEEKDLSSDKASGNLKSLIQFQVDRTEAFFSQGEPLVDLVPKWLSVDLRMFIDGGRAVLAAIRRADFDVLSDRCTVSRLTQAKLLARTWVRYRLGVLK